MDMTEKTLESREVYRGRILHVREDRYAWPNGKEGVREVVSTRQAWAFWPWTATTCCW